MTTHVQNLTESVPRSAVDPDNKCGCQKKEHFTCDRFYSCNNERCFRYGCRVHLLKLSKEKKP